MDRLQNIMFFLFKILNVQVGKCFLQHTTLLPSAVSILTTELYLFP